MDSHHDPLCGSLRTEQPHRALGPTDDAHVPERDTDNKRARDAARDRSAAAQSDLKPQDYEIDPVA